MALQTNPTAASSAVALQCLWHKALETLDEELKSSLDLKQATYDDIHLAPEMANRALYRILFIAGANCGYRSSGPETHLISACKLGYATLVELLLTKGADINVHGMVPRGYNYVP